MPKKRLAVVTMVHNEPDLLPVWYGHYVRELGHNSLYVIDHGSTVPLVFPGPEPRVTRLPTSPLEEGWRCALVSQFCNALLEEYEHVLYTDVDELIVPDPARARGLLDYCGRWTFEVTTVFGSDVVQVPEEDPIDFSRPVSAQRHWIRPYSNLCKPLLIRRPVRWSAGFHYADAASCFGGLYLFHIAYADFGMLERRQLKRVSVKRAEGNAMHHGIPPRQMVRHIRQDYADLPRRPGPSLGAEPEAAYQRRLIEAGETHGGNRLIGSNHQSPELWKIPPSFDGAF